MNCKKQTAIAVAAARIATTETATTATTPAAVVTSPKIYTQTTGPALRPPEETIPGFSTQPVNLIDKILAWKGTAPSPSNSSSESTPNQSTLQSIVIVAASTLFQVSRIWAGQDLFEV